MGASADNGTGPGLGGTPRVGGVKQPGLGWKGEKQKTVGIVLGLRFFKGGRDDPKEIE